VDLALIKDGGACRTGKTGQPPEPHIVFGYVFALKLVGLGHDKSLKPKFAYQIKGGLYGVRLFLIHGVLFASLYPSVKALQYCPLYR